MAHSTFCLDPEMIETLSLPFDQMIKTISNKIFLLEQLILTHLNFELNIVSVLNIFDLFFIDIEIANQTKIKNFALFLIFLLEQNNNFKNIDDQLLVFSCIYFSQRLFQKNIDWPSVIIANPFKHEMENVEYFTPKFMSNSEIFKNKNKIFDYFKFQKKKVKKLSLQIYKGKIN